MDACWWLNQGLRWGLLSGLISTTGVCEVTTDTLALFATF